MPLRTCLALLLFEFGPLFAAGIVAQQPAPPADTHAAEFKRRAAELVERRRSGLDESEEAQERVLKLLDSIVLEQLNRPGTPDLAAINQRLAESLAADGALGARYELVRLGATHTGIAHFALVVNFSLSGPSAVRYYPPSDQGYHLAARIDRWEFPEYFDEYLELVPIPASEVIFVTVNGRTDELRSGTFAAWRFREGRFSAVWTTDILERSSFELRPAGFQISYCSQTDEENPRMCRRMRRELYQWLGVQWRRVEQEEIGAPKPPPASAARQPEMSLRLLVTSSLRPAPLRIDLSSRPMKT